MKVQEFLGHHGIAKNPFAEEDAQTDPVFKRHCIQNTYHPSWDKIFGDPGDPATSIVFGEKGAGKTAMRLQITRHLEEFNKSNPDSRLFIINYDDFNPFLDRFVNHLPARRRRIDKALANWRLWDHMDAILTIGVTDLVDRVLASGKSDSVLSQTNLSALDPNQRRDFMLLATLYDQSTAQPHRDRWKLLSRKLRFWTLKARMPFVLGVFGSVLSIAAAITLFVLSTREGTAQNVADLWTRIPLWAYFVLASVLWLPWVSKFLARALMAQGVASNNRVSNRSGGQIRQLLMKFTGKNLSGQPLPNKERTDDRYELLDKLQGILKSMGFSGVFVLVDRVDEPHLINGSPELMKALVWPMLDNKFLKHQGIGVKMMLPAELKYYIDREDRDFAQRARLDKQNVVPSLNWTGEALFDVANARLKACSSNGKPPAISNLFSDNVSREQLIDSFRSLRVPRHLHKFLYRLLVSHCNAHTDEKPEWKVSRELFESELALYRRDLETQP